MSRRAERRFGHSQQRCPVCRRRIRTTDLVTRQPKGNWTHTRCQPKQTKARTP